MCPGAFQRNAFQANAFQVTAVGAHGIHALHVRYNAYLEGTVLRGIAAQASLIGTIYSPLDAQLRLPNIRARISVENGISGRLITPIPAVARISGQVLATAQASALLDGGVYAITRKALQGLILDDDELWIYGFMEAT